MIEAREFRERILANADGAQAAELAEEVTNAVNQMMLRGDPSPATSLLARAIAARGLLEVAADWSAEGSKLPLPVTFAALKSLVDDPPLELEFQLGEGNGS